MEHPQDSGGEGGLCCSGLSPLEILGLTSGLVLFLVLLNLLFRY